MFERQVFEKVFTNSIEKYYYYLLLLLLLLLLELKMKVLLLVFLVLLLADCNGLFVLRSKTLSRTTPSFSTLAAKSLPQATLTTHGHNVAVHNRITSSGISQSELSSSAGNEVNTSSDTVTFTNKATNAFPLWVGLAALLGVYKPAAFKWFLPYITPALTLTMASMGMTLTVNDFQRVGKSWKNVLIGFMCQYTIMPLSAYFLAKFLRLGPELATGKYYLVSILYCIV